MMKRSSFSIRRQSILNAIFATRSCTLAQDWLFIACRWVSFLLSFIYCLIPEFKCLWLRSSFNVLVKEGLLVVLVKWAVNVLCLLWPYALAHFACVSGAQRDNWQCPKCNSWKNRHRAGDLRYGGYSRERHARQKANVRTEITRFVHFNVLFWPIWEKAQWLYLLYMFS